MYFLPMRTSSIAQTCTCIAITINLLTVLKLSLTMLWISYSAKSKIKCRLKFQDCPSIRTSCVHKVLYASERNYTFDVLGGMTVINTAVNLSRAHITPCGVHLYPAVPWQTDKIIAITLHVCSAGVRVNKHHAAVFTVESFPPPFWMLKLGIMTFPRDLRMLYCLATIYVSADWNVKPPWKCKIAIIILLWIRHTTGAAEYVYIIVHVISVGIEFN
jgi:hypothetical protein